MWAKFDDGYFKNRKIRRVCGQSMLMHMTAIIHCAGAESDGFFLKDDLALIAAEAKIQIADAERLAQELVKENLFHDLGDRYEVHDFLKYNPSHEELEEKRNAASERSEMRSDAALMGRVKSRDRGMCRYCGIVVDWHNRRGPIGGTYDHVIPISQGGDSGYSNVVVCCRSCNSKKGDRTPAQSGMNLLESGILPVREPVSIKSSDPDPDPDLPSSLSVSDPDPERARSNKNAKKVPSACDWLSFFKSKYWPKIGQQYGQGISDSKALGNLGDLLTSLPEEQRLADWDHRDRIVDEFLSRSDPKIISAGWCFTFFVTDFRALAIDPNRRPKAPVQQRPGQQPQARYSKLA